MSLQIPKSERGARVRALERMVSSNRTEALPNMASGRSTLPTDIEKVYEQLPKLHKVIVSRPGTPAPPNMGHGLIRHILNNRITEGSEISRGSKNSTTRKTVRSSLPKITYPNLQPSAVAINKVKPLSPIKPVVGGKHKRKTQKGKQKKRTAKKHKK
jgi:hypothetical protein